MKGCLRTLFFLIVVYNVLSAIISIWRDDSHRPELVWFDPVCEEFLIEDEQTLDRQHQREWIGPGLPHSYCLAYQSSQATNMAQADKRAQLNVEYTSRNFWGDLYSQLVTQSDTTLNYLADSLLNVASSHAFEPLDVAKLTVSFVQDIPYSYVIPSDCESYNTGNNPCLGNQRFGIISPYEFAHSLYGDCDTRAVLLYVLLAKMGFDPMIVVSEEYAHAMLAVNLPAQGDYLEHAGKRYYFWETTARGWGIGMLPPDTNNKKYWKIALVHES